MTVVIEKTIITGDVFSNIYSGLRALRGGLINLGSLHPHKRYKITVEEIKPPVKKWRWVFKGVDTVAIFITDKHWANQEERDRFHESKVIFLQPILSTEKEFIE